MMVGRGGDIDETVGHHRAEHQILERVGRVGPGLLHQMSSHTVRPQCRPANGKMVWTPRRARSTGSVEHVVGGQELLARPEQNAILFQDKGGIVERLARTGPPLEHPDDAGNPLEAVDEFSQARSWASRKAVRPEQVLGWIAAQGQFGKNNEIAPGSPLAVSTRSRTHCRFRAKSPMTGLVCARAIFTVNRIRGEGGGGTGCRSCDRPTRAHTTAGERGTAAGARTAPAVGGAGVVARPDKQKARRSRISCRADALPDLLFADRLPLPAPRARQRSRTAPCRPH